MVSFGHFGLGVDFGTIWSLFGPLCLLWSFQVERLKEDKLELRKRLACLRLPAESGSRGEGNTGRVEGEWGRDWSVGRGQDEPDDGMITTDDLRAVVAQLRSQVVHSICNIVHYKFCNLYYIVRKPIRAIPHAQLERLRETASVRVCSWNCSCPICSRSAIIEIELDLALGTAKSENILR